MIRIGASIRKKEEKDGNRMIIDFSHVLRGAWNGQPQLVSSGRLPEARVEKTFGSETVEVPLSTQCFGHDLGHG